MKKHLNKEHLASVKKSYFNILALFLHDDKMESRYLRCLLKWGFELQLTPADMKSSNIDLANITFTQPDEKVNKLEAIYHLVYMIYLDEVVDDIELEVAAIFAQTLGFKPAVVSDLFKAIATATQDYDETYPRNVRSEVLDFLAVNEV
jgi:hypothetical protein